MNARPTSLLQALSFTVGALFVVGCGGGAFYGEAPGGIFEEEEPPDTTPPDAGKVDPPDSGPPPTVDAGDGCVTVTTTPTPADDLAAFAEAGIAAYFSTGPLCTTCHLGQSPSGAKQTWGSTADTDEGWFAACSTLLTLPRNAGKPLEETTLYAAVNGTVPVPFTGHHPEAPDARAAIEEWHAARQPATETICDGPGPGPGPGVDAGPGVDSGPGPDPDPGPCTPTLPTMSESEARYISLNLGTTFALCNACHVGTNKSGTATLQEWGAKANNPAAWHLAFWEKAKQENFASDVTQSVLHSHFNGYDGTHGVRPTERDATEAWLEYVLNGSCE